MPGGAADHYDVPEIWAVAYNDHLWRSTLSRNQQARDFQLRWRYRNHYNYIYRGGPPASWLQTPLNSDEGHIVGPIKPWPSGSS